MRRVLVLWWAVTATIFAGSQAYLHSEQTRWNMAWGYIELTNNEVNIISTVGDPPKVRMAAPVGISLGALSWGRLREDGRTIDEMVLVQGKQDERTRAAGVPYPYSLAGEFTIHLNNGGNQDSNLVPVVQGRWDCVMVKGINWGECQ